MTVKVLIPLRQERIGLGKEIKGVFVSSSRRTGNRNCSSVS